MVLSKRNTAVVQYNSREDDLRKQLARLASKVSAMKPDVKTQNIERDSAMLITGGLYTTLGAIAESVGSSGRTGYRIKPLSWRLRYHIRWNSSESTYEGTNWRILVVHDRQVESDTPPTVSNLLQQPSQPTVSLIKEGAIGRFRVLKDLQGYVSYQHTRAFGDFTINLTNVGHMEFNGAGSGDIQKNQCFAFFMCNNATNPCVITTGEVFSFTDV